MLLFKGSQPAGMGRRGQLYLLEVTALISCGGVWYLLPEALGCHAHWPVDEALAGTPEKEMMGRWA